MGDQLVNIRADTAESFVKQANKAFGGKALGNTTFSPIKKTATLDPKTKKIKTVKLETKIEVRRAHWAGAGGTKPDDKNQKALEEIESKLTAHEEAHRDGYTKVFKKLKDKYEDELVGKDPADLDAAVKAITAALRDECERLHQSGGRITFKDNGAAIVVSETAEGPGGCK